jgi:hypothetical protein
MRGELDHLAGQQLQRPTGPLAGGLEQAVATSKASSLPLNLRSVAARLFAECCLRLPSTKRRFVR